MPKTNPFSYMDHARQTKPEPAEEIPEETLSHPDPLPPPAVVIKKPKSRRQKFTTALDPRVRDAVIVELAKQRQAGKRQEFADLIEDGLVAWLNERGIEVDR